MHSSSESRAWHPSLWTLPLVGLLAVGVACGDDRYAPGGEAATKQDGEVVNSDGSPPVPTPPPVPEPSPEPTPVPSTATARYQFSAADGPAAVDLLVVVDNSGSMGEEQQALAKSFPGVIAALKQGLGGALPDLHVGVISANLGAGNYYTLPSCEVVGGDGGKLLNAPRVAGCTPPSDPWIAHDAGETNIAQGAADPAARLGEAFGCISKLGTNGCGFEQQLEAARRALDPKAAINPGFVRPDATLAVMFVTDEDDCSAANTTLYDPAQSMLTDPLGPLTSFRCFEFGVVCDVNDRNKPGPRKNCVPADGMLFGVERYVDFFKQLKPPGKLVVGAIAGPTDPVVVGKDGNNPVLEPSCQSSYGSAVPGIRLKAVIDALGGQYSSICDADFGPAMVGLGARIAGASASRCLIGLADTSPAAGLQPDCVVGERAGDGSPAVPMPACADATGCDPCPCWRLVDAPGCAGKALKVARAVPAAPGAMLEVTCQAATP